MDQRIIDLYDDFTHAHLDRRLFLSKLAQLAGSTAAALALLPILEANHARAALTSPTDQRIETGAIRYPAAAGTVQAYQAHPKGAGKWPGVIVIHENRGLNAHIEDVTRRIALEGFLALAPDLLSPVGGTPPDEDTARDLIGKLDAGQTVEHLKAAVVFLAKHPRGAGKVGAVGFCWGGGMVGQLAVHAPALAGAVVYYGPQPQAADVPQIQAPLLLHYAGEDKRINEGIAAFETALKRSNKSYTLHIYPRTQHAFNNDTAEARYNKTAADQAWGRTIAFLKETLKA